MEKEFRSDVICPVNSIEMKKEAYLDYNLEKDQRIGLIGCYCKEFAIKQPNQILDHSFKEFVEPGQELNGEDYKYCKVWAINFAFQNGMVIGSSMVVVMINVITCTIFEYIV